MNITFIHHFRFRIVVRFLFITFMLLVTFLVWALHFPIWLNTLTTVATLWFGLRFIQAIEKSRNQLMHSLEAIRYGDPMQTMRRMNAHPHDPLVKVMREALAYIRDERRRIAMQIQTYQTMIQHARIGFIVFTQDGNVEIVNQEAKHLLHQPRLKQIEKLRQTFPQLLDQIESGRTSFVIKTESMEQRQLYCQSFRYKQDDKQFTLITLSNIQAQLEETELDAWQKLIRVLTHEMMNSIAPISSLASTAKSILAQDNLTEDALGDVQTAVSTIEKRSQGLLHFVENYRKLTRIPIPNMQTFQLGECMNRINSLVEKDLNKSDIQFTMTVRPERLKLHADPDLMEQVILNLINNAGDAVKHAKNPEIMIKGSMNQSGEPVIQICDNGKGIPEELREKIFIPFFTTKPEGSGIGLALVRQIIRLHHGSIRIFSRPGNTQFQLTLPLKPAINETER